MNALISFSTQVIRLFSSKPGLLEAAGAAEEAEAGVEVAQERQMVRRGGVEEIRMGPSPPRRGQT